VFMLPWGRVMVCFVSFDMSDFSIFSISTKPFS
jgi:hypothetical protein